MIKNFIREKSIYCGEFKEIDIYSYTDTQRRYTEKKKRSKKVRESEPKQKNLNDKNARRFFVQLGNLNFASDLNALHVSLTYANENLPASEIECEKIIQNYIRRLKHKRKTLEIPPLKYMMVTTFDYSDEDKLIRTHHHIIMNGGLSRDEVEDLWCKRRKKGQVKGDAIGFANADRLQSNKNGITGLLIYLMKHPKRKKRWTCSQNLLRPTSRTNDSKYSRREVERLARERPSCEFWEKKYPGWTLQDGIHSVIYEFNDVTGWGIYLKLRKLN